MVNIKVLNGTAQEGESLCRSCRYVHRQQGYRDSQEVMYCDWGYPMKRILFSVRTCTDYAERSHPSKRDMEEIAWILSKPQSGGPIGFKSPAERRDDEDNDLAARS
jgi:hypothetical protein